MKKVLLFTFLLSTFIAGNFQNAFAQSAWNSSFEEGMKGWNPAVIKPMAGQAPGTNSVQIITEHVHNGKQALQFDVGSWSPSITVSSELLPLIKNAPYQKLHFWQLYQGAAGRVFGGRVQLYDANRAPIKDALFSQNGSYLPDGDWFPLAINFNVPKEAHFYTIELFWSVGNGKVTFDDFSLSSITTPVAIKTGYSLPQLSNANHELWVASALEKIYPDATKPKEAGTQITLSAAKGESQSVQLVYKPINAETDLTVAIDDLKSKRAAKVLSSENIDVRYVGDVDVKGDVSQFGRGGLTPDPLFPESPGTINANKPQSIWITISVPRNTSPGIYTTSVHLKTDKSKIDVPLQLEVFDFALPQKPALITNAAASNMPASARDNMRKRLLANRITSEISYNGGVQSLSLTVNPDNTVTVDWAAWDAIMEKYFSDGMNNFLVPRLLFGDISAMYRDGAWIGGVKYGTPEWRKAVGDYVKQMYTHLQQKGWLKNAIWEIYDEPMGTKPRAIVSDIAALVRQNAPEAKIMVTGWPVNPIDPNIDIWCPQRNTYLPQMRQFSKGDFWNYNNALFRIDIPSGLTEMRDETWWMWNNDITGLLWWDTTYGWSSDLYNSLTPYPKSNGQGFLFYPGADGDKSKVIDSMRIAAYRAGVNDYDYFTLLANAQDAAIQKLNLASKAPSGKELVKVLLSAGLGKNDPNLLQQIRDFTARLIVFTKDNPNAALELAPDYWHTKKLHGYAKPGTKVLFSGKQISVGKDGNFTVDF